MHLNILKKHLNNTTNVFLLLGVITSILLSFTHSYGIGYFLIVFIMAYVLPSTIYFSTIVSKIVASVLILAATVMCAGLILWLFHLELHPIYIIFSMSVFVMAYLYRTPPTKQIWIDQGDIIAILLALLLPTLLLFSYFFPRYSDWALYQFLSNGWDNSSHIVMLETAGIENSYVYGNYDDVKSRTITEAQAYPQAWHLASAHIANGFSGGTNVLNPDTPFFALRTYAIIFVVWFILAAYLLGRISWVLLHAFANRHSLKINYSDTFFFVLGNLLVQTVTITGALMCGFANFLGLLTLCLLFLCYVTSPQQNSRQSDFLLMMLIATGAILCWFLPAPALLVTIFVFLTKQKLATQSWSSFFKDNLTKFIAFIGFAVLSIAQIYIFIRYSRIDGASQLILNGGTYHIRELFMAFILAVILFYFYQYRHSKFMKSLGSSIVLLILPLVMFAMVIFLYQTAVQGAATYYYYKLSTIIGLFLGAFFIPCMVVLLKQFRDRIKSRPLAFVLCLSFIIGPLLITQQSLEAYYYAFQKNSNVTQSTSKAIERYLKKEDLEKTKLIVLTDRAFELGPPRNETFNGDLATNMSHLPLSCVYYTIYTPNIKQTFKARLARLAACADKIDEKILVITNSEKIKTRIISLNKPNIQVELIK